MICLTVSRDALFYATLAPLLARRCIPRDDIPGVPAAADLFVLRTHGEVPSIATLEAFAAGASAVVSDIPAFDEILIAVAS